MSDVKWTNTGEQIKDALTEALNSGDFKELNTLVAQTAVSYTHLTLPTKLEV